MDNEKLLRISVYHWLPMADNMLLRGNKIAEKSIEEGITESRWIDSRSIDVTYDAVSYRIEFPLEQAKQAVSLTVNGKINLRGFCQHVLDVKSYSGTLPDWLNRFVPEFCRHINNFLLEILPFTIQNNCAVLKQGILSYDQFRKSPQELPVREAAKRYLASSQIVIVVLDLQTGQTLEGVAITAIGIKEDQLSSERRQSRVLISEDKRHFVFVSPDISTDELEIHDGILYKYAAVVAFVNASLTVIDILRETRSHVPPLRDELQTALQPVSALEEDFVPFTRISRYLGYVNIKLPVIQTVRGYLSRGYRSDEFKAKLKTIGTASEVAKYSTVRSVSVEVLKPRNLVKRLDDAFNRLDEFLIEEKEELSVISDELSRHLQIALASESAILAARELESAETNRELNRGAKNRSNALKGLSIVLAGGLGLSVASITIDFLSQFGFVAPWLELAIAIILMTSMILSAWYFINLTISARSAHFRIVIEIKQRFPAKKFQNFINSKPIQRSEINRGRAVQTWPQTIDCYINKRNRLRDMMSGGEHRFDITFDYETSGFVHSLSIESEYGDVKFNLPCIVKAIFMMLKEAECLSFDTGDAKSSTSSLYANVMSQLNLEIDSDYPALNLILSETDYDFKRLLEKTYAYEETRDKDKDYIDDRKEAELSLQERELLRDIYGRWDIYKGWLLSVPNELLPLFGGKNINAKIKVFEDFNTNIEKRRQQDEQTGF